jgi:hypothetical protein
MRIIWFLLIILPWQDCFSQSKNKRKKVFIARIELADGTNAKGMLYRINDSSVEIASLEKRSKDTLVQLISIRTIETIKTRRRNSIGTGAALGITTGAIIGFMTYSDPCGPDSFFCLDFGPGIPMGIGAAIGGVVGTAVGASLQKQFKINGDSKEFDKIRDQLIAMSLKGQ